MTSTEIAAHPDVRRLIDAALDEDVGTGDVTTLALVAPDRQDTGVIEAREPLTVCGASVAAEVFRAVDDALVVEILIEDGAQASDGDAVMAITGSAASILVAERTALNFMQRLSGIASLTHVYVERTRRHGTRILDTRKTTPAYRHLEKYAVACGGGHNHRFGLFDRVLIKDNHRKLWGEQNRGGLNEAVTTARETFPNVAVEIEVESLDELEDVLRATPDWVLLDNMAIEDLRICAARCRGICQTEASGGITLDTIDRVAATGVDAVSLGCLTHSARSMDLSLELRGTA